MRSASATFRARILRSQAVSSALVVPRNWSRFSKASISVCCTTSDGSIRAVETCTELKTREKFQIMAKPFELLPFRHIRWLHFRPLVLNSKECPVADRARAALTN